MAVQSKRAVDATLLARLAGNYSKDSLSYRVVTPVGVSAETTVNFNFLL
jgi:hypothetical protein